MKMILFLLLGLIVKANYLLGLYDDADSMTNCLTIGKNLNKNKPQIRKVAIVQAVQAI